MYLFVWDTIYDVPLNTGIIPQSLADERPSLENQKIETVTFRNSREAKIAVMNWEPHATGQLNVRLMINHSGVKVDRVQETKMDGIYESNGRTKSFRS